MYCKQENSSHFTNGLVYRCITEYIVHLLLFTEWLSKMMKLCSSTTLFAANLVIHLALLWAGLSANRKE